MERFRTRILMREGAADYLDALRSSTGAIVVPEAGKEAYLRWGSSDYLYRFRVRIEEVLQPVPTVRIAYLEAPERVNRRREWRSPAKIGGRFSIIAWQWTDRGAVASDPYYIRTMSRDISPSAVRFYSPDILRPDTQIIAAWQVGPDYAVEGTMTVLRTLPEPSTFREIAGYDVVALWTPPLQSLDRNLWTATARQHRNAPG